MPLPESNRRRRRVTGTVINAESVFKPTVGAPANRTALALADLEAERAVVAGVLQRVDLYPTVAALLQPGDFYQVSLAYIWFALEKCAEAGELFDLLTIARRLDGVKGSPLTGDAAIAELTKLYAATPNPDHIERHARLVREASTRIRMLTATVEMQSLLFDRTTQGMLDAVVDKANRMLFESTEQWLGLDDTSAKAAMSRYWDALESRMALRKDPGIPSGWPKWDDPLTAAGGLYPGDVTVIAGKEGFGKTTWLLSLVRNVLRAGKHVVLFTLEMRDDEIMQVYVSQEAAIPKATLRAGALTDAQWAAFVASADNIAAWPLEVVDEFRSVSNPLTPTTLRRKLRFLLSRQPVDLVAIDGLWLMEHDDSSQRYERVAKIMSELSDIAKGELGCPFPIAITHQYNSDVANSKKVKKPTAYHLAESAGVRRNAQVIVGLWRSENSEFMEAHLLKDRGVGNAGYTGYFKYDKKRSLYEESE